MPTTTMTFPDPTRVMPTKPTPSYVVLQPDRQPLDTRRPFSHQREAWARLSAHLEESQFTGALEGVMVMPTGAGKTYTAVTWLMTEVVNNGGRIVWIAHRDELLEQAAVAFHRAAGLANRRQSVTIRIVSGQHCKAEEINPADDVIVVSVATLAHHPEIVARLLDDPRTFVVIDEFHHAVAPTYRTILDPLRARPSRRLLGLTATPTRTIANERPVLAELFGDRVIFEVGPTELIERGILARPSFVRVRTGCAIDRGLSTADRDYLRQFGDFSPAWLDRIARIESRNHAIVDHYLQHRSQYGKTLIFAVSIAHTVLLTERLRASGVAAGYVASTRHDGGDNRRVLSRFREREGGLEVVVNVGLLTEGADFPAIQTVLLARPTISEILIEQMIGRALRGPAVGGTEIANVVWFEDRSRRIDKWRNTLDRVEARFTANVTTRSGLSQDGIDGTTPPWSAVEAVAYQIRSLVPPGPIESLESVVERWFVTSGGDGAPRECRLIATCSDQRDAYDAAMNYLERLPAEELATISASTLAAMFFGTTSASPQPMRELGLLLAHFCAEGRRPECYRIEDRLACDPRTVARLIADGDLGERARSGLLVQRYTPLAQAIYPTPRDYRTAVEDALYALHPFGNAS